MTFDESAATPALREVQPDPALADRVDALVWQWVVVGFVVGAALGVAVVLAL